MKIPHPAMPDCYKIAKQAYDGRITEKEAQLKIHQELKISFTSSKDYPKLLRILLTDNGNIWGLGAFTYDVFLENILADYGKEQLKKSIATYERLIEYLEKKGKPKKIKMRAVYDKFYAQI
jgi:hypothetical protein